MCIACRPASRRGFLASAGALAALAAPTGRAHAQGVARPATPDAALRALAEGHARYLAGQPRERDISAGRAALAVGQAPYAAILGCADSRVAPEHVFDGGPGDLFVVRVAGNFVTRDGLGSLEFGAAVLGTKAILVLGHTSCGAVNATTAALRQGNNLPGSIAPLVTAMKPGIEPALAGPAEGLAARALAANVRHAVQRLEADSPILSALIAAGSLKVVGGIYDLATGRVGML